MTRWEGGREGEREEGGRVRGKEGGRRKGRRRGGKVLTRSMRSERFFSICCGGSLLIKSSAQSNCWSCLDWREEGEGRGEEGGRGRVEGKRRGKGQREREIQK